MNPTTLSLELNFAPTTGATGPTAYGQLNGQEAYDAWYLAHYCREILEWKELTRDGCSFDAMPRKEKNLLTYLALGVRPDFRSVLEIGSGLFEIIDGLRLVRRTVGDKLFPPVDIDKLRFMGVENSKLLADAAAALHPESELQAFEKFKDVPGPVDLIIDRAVAGLMFEKTEDYANALLSANAGIMNLLVSRTDSFLTSALDRPLVYFSLRELIECLHGRLYHLFGVKSPGLDRSQGRPVVEGFFLFGDHDFAQEFIALGRKHPEVKRYFAEKDIEARPASDLLVRK